MGYGEQVALGIVVGHVDIKRRPITHIGKPCDLPAGDIHPVPCLRQRAGCVGLGVIHPVGHSSRADRRSLGDKFRRRRVCHRECVPTYRPGVIVDEKSHRRHRRLLGGLLAETIPRGHSQKRPSQRGHGEKQFDFLHKCYINCVCLHCVVFQTTQS